PYKNMSVYRVMDWMFTGKPQKSKEEINRLAHNVLSAEDFRVEDLVDFNTRREAKRLSEAQQGSLPYKARGSWHEKSIPISVLTGSKAASKMETFNVTGMHYCPLIEVIKEAFSSPLAKKFHLFPFKQFFQANSTAPVERVPDQIQDFITKKGTHRKSHYSPLLTHCRRELFLAVWQSFLDDEFLHAYKHGIVLKCSNGVVHCIYPCVFTYSADYPEKVLIATTRDMGQCPCPRCLVLKSEIPKMGQVRDLQAQITKARRYTADKIKTAREFIYRLGYSVTSSAVEGNSFADRLNNTSNVFTMLVVDIMHEFELGVWKAVFTHLIHILHASVGGSYTVAKLDARFRQISPFGQSTIRCFSNNASEMKKLAARDFEDLLQVCTGYMYVHQNCSLVVIHLLYVTCAVFRTKELPREVSSRTRRKKHNSTSNQPCVNDNSGSSQASRTNEIPRQKKFNLLTYKIHALGDYVKTIRLFGTTDSYTTQIGESAHRIVKQFYRRMNKKDPIKQMTQLERHATHFHNNHSRIPNNFGGHPHQTEHDESDTLVCAEILPKMHHRIASPRNIFLNIFLWSHSFPSDDPAFFNFISKLKNHILSRLLGLEHSTDGYHFNETDHDTIKTLGNKLYPSSLLHINYTTYDVRCDQDIVNTRMGGNIMALSSGATLGSHAFWYAHVLGIFQLQVLHTGPSSANLSVQHIQVLWVRWFEIVKGYHTNFLKTARLPKVKYMLSNNEAAFEFLDPSLVIRGCHLIPCFADGRTSSLLPCIGSTGLAVGESDEWASYYVNIFVDRDMFMRYRGKGIGHAGTRILQQDFDGDNCETSDNHHDTAEKDDDLDSDATENEATCSQIMLSNNNLNSDNDLEDDSELDPEGYGTEDASSGWGSEEDDLDGSF
ncbi:hypothetical protein SERLA73DRAFT_53415, partial [Serpula lacrymans var. lacrymans S7.3]